MINKVNNIQIQDLLGKPSSRQADKSGVEPSEGVDISLQADYASLIEKAKQLPQDDGKAVEAARQLLLSGKLESPENIRAAAENIIKFGI